MVTVCTFTNNVDAWLAHSLLASEGIEAVVADDNIDSLYAPVALGARLQVAEEDEQRAREILEKHEGFEPLEEDFVPPETVPATDDETSRERPSLAREWGPMAFCLLVAFVVAWGLFMQFAPPEWLYGSRELIKSGNAFYEKKDYDSALKYYNAAMALKPSDATLRYDRGLAYYQKGDSTRALADFSQAIQATPDLASYTMRARIYRETGQAALALADYGKVIDLAPGDAAGYRERAELHEDSGQWEAAIGDLNKAITLDHGSTRPLALNDRAFVYYRLGEYDLGLADVNEALNIVPAIDEDRQAYVTRAYIYSETGEYDKALADWGVVLKHNPEDSIALVGRGEVFNRTQEYDKALADLDKSIEIDPKNPSAYLARGDAHSGKGEPVKAIEDYKRFMEIVPEKAFACAKLAWLYSTCPQDNVRDGAKAMELATKACELTQWRDFYSIGALAAAEAETGRFDDAVKHALQAQAIGKQDKIATKENLGEIADALKAYQQGKPFRDTGN